MNLVLTCLLTSKEVGVVGESSGYSDNNGRMLFVGDVVKHWHQDNPDEIYTGVMIVGRKGSYCEGKHFLDGIESVCVEGEFTGGWVTEYSHSLREVGDKDPDSLVTVVEKE